MEPSRKLEVVPETLRYEAPERLTTSAESYLSVVVDLSVVKEKECPICLIEFAEEGGTDVVVQLSCADHFFHRKCILAALETSPRCPICRKQVGGGPQGTCPSGSMGIRHCSQRCRGYESTTTGTIMINYSLHRGVQRSYHPNPGYPYPSTFRTAYLPLTKDGLRLLKRLKYAFLHGLTFTVGTSLTTGQSNRIVWSSIHHKTSLSGGIRRHGFPDEGFFLNCNEELDALGVPSADDI